jgi:hypothetical protein
LRGLLFCFFVFLLIFYSAALVARLLAPVTFFARTKKVPRLRVREPATKNASD